MQDMLTSAKGPRGSKCVHVKTGIKPYASGSCSNSSRSPKEPKKGTKNTKEKFVTLHICCLPSPPWTYMVTGCGRARHVTQGLELGGMGLLIFPKSHNNISLKICVSRPRLAPWNPGYLARLDLGDLAAVVPIFMKQPRCRIRNVTWLPRLFGFLLDIVV